MTLAKLRTRSRVKGLKIMKIKCWLCLNELDTETDYMVISPSTGEKCLFYCEKHYIEFIKECADVAGFELIPKTVPS